MISKAVTNYAREHGYEFFVNGCGHRKLAQIVTVKDKQKIGWTANRSLDALNSINALVNQARLSAKSDADIMADATQAKELIEPSVHDFESSRIDMWDRQADRVANGY